MIIVTGSPQSGKSTLVQKQIERIRQSGSRVAGILARGLWQNGVRSGFDLIDLSCRKTTPLCRRIPEGGLQNGIPFAFFHNGIDAGHQALSPDRCAQADVVVVDEVGFLELEGKGWAPCLEPLLALTVPYLIWVVRSVLVEPVCRKWHLTPQAVICATEPDAADRLEKTIKKHT